MLFGRLFRCPALASKVILFGLMLPLALPAADWVRAGLNTNQPVWGLRGGLLWAIPPGSFSGGSTGGPRGLIRLGYPTLTNGGYDLLNFIAVEPVVQGRKGFSELEESVLDHVQGKRFWVGPTNGAVTLTAGEISAPAPGVEQLTVTLRVEPFENGAHVRVDLMQRSDAPGELRLKVTAEADSAPLEQCILTATMGNKARLRTLHLPPKTESSLRLYADYREADFAPHRFFPLARLPRATNGDVLVAATPDETDPASAVLPERSRFWRYRGRPVTQYWRRPAAQIREDLQAVVNGRYVYWKSRQPIPGGVAFENFELQEKFRPGQEYIFGISVKTPAELLP